MHEEIDGVDDDIELYIQYFNYNFKEMHGTTRHRSNSKKFSDLTLTEDDENEELLARMKQKAYEEKVAKRFSRNRALRNCRHSLKYGTNVPLHCVNSHGKIKTMLAYARHTEHEISVVISNFEGKKKDVWVDFSPLKDRMKNLIGHETTILKLQYWDDESKFSYHLVNEFLNCPSHFRVGAYDTALFQIFIEGNIKSHPEFYGEARNNFVATLKLIEQANHMETSHIYSNYIKHLVECYNAHRDPGYADRLSSGDKELVDFHSFVSKDPTVHAIIEEIVEKNLIGPIVFVTPEYAPWFKIGGLAVMVDELARGFANLGEDTYAIVPYYQYKKGGTEIIDLDPDGKYGINYLFNIHVNIGKCHEVFGIHHGVVGGVKVYFIHHSVQFFEPYPGLSNDTRLRACTLF